MLNKLNIKIEEFKIYKSLKDFNAKLNLSIEDIDIEELDLKNRYIDNEEMKYLAIVEFKKLKKLILNGNNIDNIEILEKVKFDKLEMLDLSNNQISDINILKTVNFKNIKVLDFHENNISDINILENVSFEKLEILILKN
jgi:Leucine-rich repeat (LRR) protein